MKRIITICLLTISGVSIWSSCDENILDIDPPVPSESTYYQTEEQLNKGVIGIYAKLVFFYQYRGYAGSTFLHDLRLMQDDDLTMAAINNYDVFSLITQNDQKNHDNFKYLYELNARANNLLYVHDQKAESVYSDENLKNSHRGEMLFLRGYSNFMLWNYYGVAPLIMNRILTEEQLYPSNSEGNALLDAAIQDFKEAATLLPASWPDNWKGRVTKGSALGMAAKALVFRASITASNADYTDAIAQIDNMSGYSLQTNFYDNFDVTKENNTESVFEIQLGPNSAVPEQSNPWLSNDQFAANGNISAYYGYFDGHWSSGGANRITATQSITAFYPSDDGRITSSFDPSTGYILKYVKFGPDGGGGEGNGGNFAVAYHNNQRILRFSEIKLLKAEALVQSGGSTTEAINLINEVRTRARGAGSAPVNRSNSETDRDEIMRWIIDERRLELAFEDGIRWLDLRRWHMGGILMNLYGKDLTSTPVAWDFSSAHSAPNFEFTEKNLYYPIPLTEIQLNPNLSQNPLWDAE